MTGHRDRPLAATPAAHPWMPVAVCDVDCLPPAGSEPRVGRPRRWLRLAGAVTLLAGGLPLAAVSGRCGRRRRDAALVAWSRLAVAAFGVRLEVSGPPVPPGSLLAANHVSWLDVVALNAVHPTCMVAKREVRDWPVVGRLATAAGTFYLDRERLSTLPVAVADLAAALRRGQCVALFPEGTTWCGRRGGRFRSAAFQAALDADAPVVPVTLSFVLADGTPTATPAYVGADPLWRVLRRTAALRGLTVRVQVRPALAAREHGDRRALAQAVERAAAGRPVEPVEARLRAA